MGGSELDELHKLSVVNRICGELDNHLGFSDKDLAEMLLAMASKTSSFKDFFAQVKALDEDFPELLAESVHRLVESMKPKKKETKAAVGARGEQQEKVKVDRTQSIEAQIQQRLRSFPGLSIPDTAPVKLDEVKRPREDSPRIGHKRPRKLPSEPQVDDIYTGTVSSIKDYGCFVTLDGFTGPKGRVDGLVHISCIQAPGKGRISHPSDVVKVRMKVMVKVLSKSRDKISLSMKDVDQATGRDLEPKSRSSIADRHVSVSRNGAKSNPASDRPFEGSSGGIADRNANKRMSSPERWETQQLISSGVLPVSAYPSYDRDQGLLGYEETEEEFEVEVREEEPLFLKGQTKISAELDPVKIVKNADGTLQRAAMTQSALAKERREIKQAQEREEESIDPRDLNHTWLDPTPQDGGRRLAGEARVAGFRQNKIPEWKRSTAAQNVSYGQVSQLSLREQRRSLPIYTLRKELIKAFVDNQILVVIGETGSGKTTQMTQYFAEAGYAEKGVIGCTQPRRVAAISVAKRVAEEYGCRVGEDVGYSIRFEDCTGPQTVIKYMTDGMLMREYLMDNTLSRYSVLMIDEAHERTRNTDILFALLKILVKKRPDFKLIVTSATLDADKFSKYFYECPIFTIPGRTFPVEVLYAKAPESDYMEAALITVMQIHLSEPAGDILLFLTGQEEIETACEVLFERMKALGSKVPELILLPAYGQLPSEMQSRIFEPAPPGTRKCVIATNIAEASLTIDGIYYVVDPGFHKQNVYNAKLGMDSLVVVPISQDSARQRAGRAGRTGPGKCYRLYTEMAYKEEMLPTTIPELQRINLSPVVLQLKAMGVNNLLEFDFLDPPPAQTLIAAMEKLYALGALDDEGLMTRFGRKMAEFPLEPVLAKTLLTSVELGCAEEVVTVVSMLSVDSPFYRPREKQAQADQKRARFLQPEGDHLTLLAVYEAWKNSKYSNPWCYENFIQARSVRKAQDVRKQLLGIMDRYRMDISSCGRDYDKIRKSITSGFFMHAAKRDPQEGYKTLVEGQPVYIHPSSALFNKNPEWLIYDELVLTTKEYMRNTMTIDPKWLVEFAPTYFKKADATKLSKRKRAEKIEPLSDRWAQDKDAWRLSRRRG